MLTNLLRTIKADTSGSSAVEYGLIVSLIIVAILVGMQEVANETMRCGAMSRQAHWALWGADLRKKSFEVSNSSIARS